MEHNPFGFVMLLALGAWIAYTVKRAYMTGEIYSAGIYTFRRDENPFMYWMVFLIHVGIVLWFAYLLATL